MQQDENDQHESADAESRHRFEFIWNLGQQCRQIRHKNSLTFLSPIGNTPNPGANFLRSRFWGTAPADYTVTFDGTKYTKHVFALRDVDSVVAAVWRLRS